METPRTAPAPIVERSLITAELAQRSQRPPSYEAQTRIFDELLEDLANATDGILDRIASAANELCEGRWTGVGIVNALDGRAIRWHARAGTDAADLMDAETLEAAAALTIERNDPQLLGSAEAGTEPANTEALLVPFQSAGKAAGVICVVAANGRRFDLADTGVLSSLGRLASAAYRMLRFETAADDRTNLIDDEHRLRQIIDGLPTATYMTDAEGYITHANRAAVELAGREPEAGERWCVSWKIYRPDGTPVPHEQCPMAIALREGQITPGAQIVVEQPGGERRRVAPYPTLLRDDRQRIVGAVNMLVDVTAQGQDETGALLAAIVSASDDAIVSKTLDGEIRSWNEGAERLFGYTAEQAIGRSINLIVPPELREEEREILKRLRRGERIDHFETERMAKDGRRVMVSITVSPVRDSSGRIIGASNVSRDITDRKLAEDRLRLSEGRYRSLLDLMPVAMYSCNASGEITYYNHHAATLWGLEPSLGTPDHLFCGSYKLYRTDGSYLPHEQSQMAVALREGREFRNSELQIERPDGSRIAALVNIGPLRDADARIVGAINVFQDMSALKGAEEALRTANRRKDEFLAMLGHELRNPLAPLQYGLELLEGVGNGPQPLESVRPMMERQLRHLTRLVDDLLDISRITSGRIELHREAIDLNTVVDAAVELSMPLINERRHELEIVRTDMPLRLLADAERLTQAVSNLLNNAARYSDPGGQIQLLVGSGDGLATIAVHDTGYGIPPDRLDDVFGMFTQVSEHQTRLGSGGLGLGLPLTKRLIALHGGEIQAASEGLGQGSRFTISLPLDSSIELRAPTTVARVTDSQNARRVLIVDDNADAAESLRILLEIDGHTTEVSHDGEAALELMERFSPEVVLLDIGLPRMSGYEVARRIRERWSARELLLCAVTGWGQTQHKRRALEAGFDRHFTKPLSSDALRKVVAEAPAHAAVPQAKPEP